MSRDRWDDDSSPRRSRYEEYDDYPEDDYGRPERSGAVTGVAVISFVLGGLVILFGLCGLLGALVQAGEGMHGPGGGFAGLGNLGFAVAFVILLFILLWGIGAIVAGVGVINRRQWGRVLALVLGGIAAVAGLLSLFAAVMVMATPALGPFDDIRVMIFMIYLLLAMVFLGYCIWTYVVLLNSRYSAEFG
jgi:hypothetical protein